MKRSYLLFSASLICLLPTHFARGQDASTPVATQTNETVEHYEHIKFDSSPAAREALDKTIIEMDGILSQEGALEFTEIESVHEKSYLLESAVDQFRTDKAYPEQNINSLDEAVQGLHFSSENQDFIKTRDWFMKIKTATNNLTSAPQTEAIAAPKAEKKEFYEIVIKDHKFLPELLKVPAGEKIKLIVDNQDSTPEEFESHDLKREKIISGNSKATIFIGPLDPGTYHFFGEFNMATAKGDIIAE